MAVAEGTTFSLMFQIVQINKKVDPMTSRLVDPSVGPKKNTVPERTEATEHPVLSRSKDRFG